jgi:carbamoyltransferase
MDERIAHFYVHHHRAHAASAFRLSGLDEACIITVDGKGDGFSATIYRGHPDGTMELLRSTPAKHSIGSFYQAVTEALGFVPVDSEYKTMGLAAMGETTQDRNPFTEVIRVEDGVFRASIPWDFRRFNDHNPGMRVENPLSSVAQADDFKRYLVDLSPEQLAYFAQDHFEKNMLDFVRDALRIAQSDQLVGAGGALLNVKANALIRDELRPADFFVFPDAGDSGLAAGAALEALHHVEALSSPPVFANPYLGHGFDEADLGGKIAQRARTHDLRFREVSPDDIAEELIRGKAIGTFQGRLEMGPRALGNRSVLADPRSNAMKDRINGILKGREWFVPFAPAVLRDDAHLFWKGSPEYRYMTFAVEASEYAKKTVPAVVHVDGTMRPQVVSPESNFWLYQVLQSFKKRTGVGVLLNTSFNRHGVPIVAAPEDAFEHLENGWVDGLSMARWYIERRCSPQCKP